jgi:ATP-dependent 26S proteasome regulatory subunit
MGHATCARIRDLGRRAVTAHAKRSFRDNLALLLRARFPVLYVESFEEPRVVAEIAAVASDQNLVRTVRPLYVWSATRGFVAPDGATQSGTTDPKQAVDWMLRQDGAGVFVMLDLHAHLGDDRRPADPALIRALRDIAAGFQVGASARVLVMVSPLFRIPSELEKDITLVDFPLPDEREIRSVLDDMIATNTSNDGRIRIEVDTIGRERLAKAALGLTLNEATNAFARAMVDDGVLSNDDVHVIMEEKKQTVRKAGLLEFVDVNLDLADVGGLQNLKRWLSKRNNSWLAEAAEYGLPAPKGVLMTGIPGCGKSLTAKAIAAAWELPLLRLDIGKVFAGLVGSSEQNMRSAIRTAEAAAPCILWLDEIERGFSGVSGDGDSGTSSRVFGSFLTWMQEKTAPVFVIATANKVDRLPPEFLRKGRFDEIFFVDLPTRLERRDIWALHLSKRLKASKAGTLYVSDSLLDTLADVTEGYAGAEIEHAVVAALFDAFADRRALVEEDLVRAVRNMVPLSVTQAEEIAAVRAWAANRAVAATATEDRSGYETSAPDAPQVPPTNGASPTPSPEPLARGGRVVDF